MLGVLDRYRKKQIYYRGMIRQTGGGGDEEAKDVEPEISAESFKQTLQKMEDITVHHSMKTETTLNDYLCACCSIKLGERDRGLCARCYDHGDNDGYNCSPYDAFTEQENESIEKRAKLLMPYIRHMYQCDPVCKAILDMIEDDIYDKNKVGTNAETFLVALRLFL